MLESLFDKITGLQGCNFIKKRQQHGCFLVNIAKFLKTPICFCHLLINLIFKWHLMSVLCQAKVLMVFVHQLLLPDNELPLLSFFSLNQLSTILLIILCLLKTLKFFFLIDQRLNKIRCYKDIINSCNCLLKNGNFSIKTSNE